MLKRGRGTIRNYLELARISNLATCLTNVLVGCALASEPLSSTTVISVSVIIALMYVGGMILNDVIDARIDRLERPGRPIPSGRVDRAAAGWVAGLLLALAGLLLAWWFPRALPAGVLLIAAIVAYDVLHKRHPATAVLMGTCRALVYVVGAAAAGGAAQRLHLILFASALGLYVMVLTIIAQREHTTTGWRGHLIFLLPASALLALPAAHSAVWWFAGAAGLMWLMWWWRSAGFLSSAPPRAIMGWLAGICLLDAFFLALLGESAAVIVALGAFVLTVWAQRRILGS